jgi:hypothetical protein
VVKRWIALAALALVAASAGCSQPKPAAPAASSASAAAAVPAARYDVSIPLKELMEKVLDPATDVVWSASGIMVDFKGEHDLAPKTDAAWAKIHDAAMVVAEGGNLLQLPGRARAGVTWGRESQKLTRLGLEAMAAADHKDKEAMLRIGGDLHDACEECHRVYVLGEAPKP